MLILVLIHGLEGLGDVIDKRLSVCWGRPGGKRLDDVCAGLDGVFQLPQQNLLILIPARLLDLLLGGLGGVGG